MMDEKTQFFKDTSRQTKTCTQLKYKEYVSSLHLNKEWMWIGFCKI